MSSNTTEALIPNEILPIQKTTHQICSDIPLKRRQYGCPFRDTLKRMSPKATKIDLQINTNKILYIICFKYISN